MKVKELQQQLDEGFFDNLVAKVKDMASGDGPTGIIRALRGSNASLRKLADAITNGARPRVTQRLGNQIDQINSGSVPLPVKVIYQQALAVAAKLAAADKMTVEPDSIKTVLKNNRPEIERLVLTDTGRSNAEIKLLFDAILGATGTASIGMELEPAMAAISLIIAAGVVFIQTSQEDTADVDLDQSKIDQFVKTGNTLIKILAQKSEGGSSVPVALKANDQYKENIHELVISIIARIKKSYVSASNADLASYASSVPTLVSPKGVANAIGSHRDDIDQTQVNDAANRISQIIQNHFKEWLGIASTEDTPGHPKSYELYTNWAKKLLNDYLDGLDTSESPASKPSPAAGDEPEETFTKADEAGRAAMAALTQNSGESDSDFNKRQYAEFEKARNAYLTAHPLP